MECPNCKDADLYTVVQVYNILLYTDEKGDTVHEMVESVRDLYRGCPSTIECTNCGYVKK